MKRLFIAAFGNRKNYSFIAFIIIAMVFLTLASQMEILTIGIITKKGPDAFELFAPEKNGKLEKSDVISWNDVQKRWDDIDIDNKQYITKNDTIKFLATTKNPDLIQRIIDVIDNYLPISNNLRNLAGLIIIVALFKAITLFSYRFSSKVLSIKISQDLRQKYFEHLQTLPMDFFQKYNIGSLSSRVVGDAVLIAESVNAMMMNYLQTPFTVITTFILCLLTSWKLSLLIFVGFPAILIPIVFISKKVRKIARQIQKNQENFSSILIDFLSGIHTVKIFAMENFSLKKYREQNEQMARLEKKSAKYDLSSRPIVHSIAMLCLSISMLWGLFVLKLSVSEAFFFCGLLFLLYEPIKKFAEENAQIQRGVAASDRMMEVMSIKPAVADETGALELDGFNESLEFDKVSFRYGDQWVLKDLSFSVKKGETVAICGPTGAGKSTIVQLIPRLYDVQEGEIRIDGKPLKTYTQKSIRENISFVPQKPFLFLDTIAENISFGRPFTKEQIVNASVLAHADEFIQKLPNKYDTHLAETGKNLSGGQQQRLAIARALVKKAPILIMDEATSSLDTVSEKLIKDSIRKLKGQVTQIIIAHRLSTIEDADKIIYLEDGKKVAQGTKNELIKICPGFKKMWEAFKQ